MRSQFVLGFLILVGIFGSAGSAFGQSASRDFEVTLDSYSGAYPISVSVKLYPSGSTSSDDLWSDTDYQVTSDGGTVTVVAPSPGFYDVYLYAARWLRLKVADVKFGSPPTINVAPLSASKIGIYWPEFVGASGYNVYRTTSPGACSSSTPINTSPVTARAFDGSPYFAFIDTGRSSSSTYYYVVKAISPLGQISDCSDEDNAKPTSTAIPWDSQNPSQIISAVAALQGPYSGTKIRVVGPDGQRYDSDLSFTLGISGWESPDTNLYDSPSDVELGYPNDQKNSQGIYHTGPFRRVEAKTGYRVATIYSLLPFPSQVIHSPKTYTDQQRSKRLENGHEVAVPWVSSDDAPYIYLGSRASGGSTIDAGLRWRRNDTDTDLSEWQSFFAAVPSIDTDGTEKPGRKEVTVALGELLATIYGGLGGSGVLQLSLAFDAKAKIGWLFVYAGGQPFSPIALVSYIKGYAADGSNVYFRRVISVAQTFRGPNHLGLPVHADYTAGFVHAGTLFSNVNVYNAKLSTWDSVITDFVWDNSRTNSSTTFPTSPSGVVSYSPTTVSDHETVTIDLRP